MRETNVASYEFFKGLLPPPRYVNTDFRFYRIVLSAPNGKVNARFISNASDVNLRGGSHAWTDKGTPILLRIGPDKGSFGDNCNESNIPRLRKDFCRSSRPVISIPRPSNLAAPFG